MVRNRFRKHHVALALLAVTTGARADDEALVQRMKQLEAEVAELKSEVHESSAAGNGGNADTQLFSYGEIHFNRPVDNANGAQADVHRVVLGYQHRFDDRTKAVVELEYEHAVTSADDPGETEVEQAYVEHEINGTVSGKAGLFLIPMGLLNENHEPTAFYGVERNFVETAIIPSTWREGGAMATVTLDNGLTLQGGLTTSFDLGKWDATSTDGQSSPLGAVHQELAKAKAKNSAWLAAVNWRGVPGLQLGAAAFTGGVGQDTPTLSDSRLLLWDVHARWTPGKWDIAAIYARGTLSHTADFNQTLVGNPVLVPERFDGSYVQAAYRLWQNDEYNLSPFARLETYNTGASYADIGAGLTPDPLPTQHVVTVGANFGIGHNVVLKVDGQRIRPDSSRDRYDVGIGWSF